MKKQVCLNCKGKGHVVDKALMVFVPVISLVIAFIENDDGDSDTRVKCNTCNGKGYIQL